MGTIIRKLQHYFRKIKADKVLRPIIILNPNKRSRARQIKKYKNKTRKGESTTSKSYKKSQEEVKQKSEKSQEEVKPLHKTEENTKKERQLNRKKNRKKRHDFQQRQDNEKVTK